MPSQIGCGEFRCGKFGGSPWISHGKFGGHSQKTTLSPLAPKVRKQNFDLTPEFRVANLAAKLKRQISNANLTWLQIPPPIERQGGTFNVCIITFSSCCTWHIAQTAPPARPPSLWRQDIRDVQPSKYSAGHAFVGHCPPKEPAKATPATPGSALVNQI